MCDNLQKPYIAGAEDSYTGYVLIRLARRPQSEMNTMS
jgi:hypothetical protein